MKSILGRIYGEEKGEQAFSRLDRVIREFSHSPAAGKRQGFTQADAVLITYGDTLVKQGEKPLQTLHRFCLDHFKGVFSAVHILPFFPYSSDDGFSVTDFMAVRPDLGTWEDIRAMGRDFALMVDLVANHVSAKSRWFKCCLAGDKGFEDLVVQCDPTADLSCVTRPRARDLLTCFETSSGKPVHVWTTFSADQVDLNYQSLDVLESMVRVLLYYVSMGARIIRLDAIAYLWKQVGTCCVHLPQTHDMVRLFRAVLDRAAPHVALVTETNVPHEENISYFGNGGDEAQMVYNFTLPPLLLDALANGRADDLSKWAKTLVTPSSETFFFNFTASHDGIGVRPLEGILPDSRLAALVERVKKNKGQISQKQNPDGGASPYELNITYVDALKDPDAGHDPLHIPRFLASQAAALVLPGVPGVYIHSILGSTNWTEGVARTGRARTINRQKLAAPAVNADLADPDSFRAKVFHPYLHMVRVRTRQPAFHPGAGMEVLEKDPRVFAVRRFCPEQTILAAVNLCAQPVSFTIPDMDSSGAPIDLLSGKQWASPDVTLAPFQAAWLCEE